MAIPSGKFPSPDPKYPFVGANYQKYGEADGYIYDPYTDKYYINPETYKETAYKTGAMKKPENTGLMATLIPIVGVAGATEIAKALGVKAVPALSDLWGTVKGAVNATDVANIVKPMGFESALPEFSTGLSDASQITTGLEDLSSGISEIGSDAASTGGEFSGFAEGGGGAGGATEAATGGVGTLGGLLGVASGPLAAMGIAKGMQQGGMKGAATGGLSGAGFGAGLGTMVLPGVGTALGALIGGLFGGGAGFMGNKPKIKKYDPQQALATAQLKGSLLGTQLGAGANLANIEKAKELGVLKGGTEVDPATGQFKANLPEDYLLKVGSAVSKGTLPGALLGSTGAERGRPVAKDIANIGPEDLTTVGDWKIYNNKIKPLQEAMGLLGGELPQSVIGKGPVAR
jgi:hypothetical protein